MPQAPAPIMLQKGRDKRVRLGHPWVYSNEIIMPDRGAMPAAGSYCRFINAGGEGIGYGFFNPHSLIAGRILLHSNAKAADAPDLETLLQQRLGKALALRQRCYDAPFYRLVHAEADGLPGLILDRFGDTIIGQANSAGMDLLRPMLGRLIQAIAGITNLLWKNDSPARQQEGLENGVELAFGNLPGPLSLRENGITFHCDPINGQKTGWFYDHRDNRAMIARFAAGKNILDLYSYAGAFSLAAGMAGNLGSSPEARKAANYARRVDAFDRSQDALDLAKQSAIANGLDDRVHFHRQEVFAALDQIKSAGEGYDIVIADPPAFAKSRKDHAAALRGYAKLARDSALCVRPDGLLFIASCSHAVNADEFFRTVINGLQMARRSGRVLRATAAGYDHPLHPLLPESAYLKGLLIQLD